MKFKIAGWGSGVLATNRNDETRGSGESDIQCFSLNTIMAAVGVRHIDFMVLDVEGAELSVLNTIDWSTLTIDVWSIEFVQATRKASLEKLNKLRYFFQKNGMYNEVGILPRAHKEGYIQDVVFMRKSIAFND